MCKLTELQKKRRLGKKHPKFLCLTAIGLCVAMLSGCMGEAANTPGNTSNVSETSVTSEDTTAKETGAEGESQSTENNEEKVEMIYDFSKATKEKIVTVDVATASTKESTLMDGVGFISANNSSRLLLDYKTEQPEVYWKLLRYIFGEEGLGLNLIKIEMGADVDSSSGTEPAVKRSAEEAADVTRGAGYQLTADALTIRPDLMVDMLYWGIPAWVNEAEDSYAAMYQWYKETIDAMYDTYGIRLTYVTACQNERGADVEWLKYFSKALENETDERYDYGSIQIVAGEEVGTWKLAAKMLEDEELMDAVDVISSHYTSFTTDEVKKLQEQYGKKVWFSEGSSPMGYGEGTYRFDEANSGIMGLNGGLDIATRITQAIAEGMTMYEFQPVVAAYYDGVTYCQKQLITANEPWNGSYSLDAGFYLTMQLSRFIKKDWAFVKEACYGDGVPGGDGHAIVDSVYNYVTATDPQTGDLSEIIVNNSAETIAYTFELSNCDQDIFHVWSSAGPGVENTTDYYENFFVYNGIVKVADGKLKVLVQPYSMVTVSTLDIGTAEENIFVSELNHERVDLPYKDDFEYSDYAADYLEKRGMAPRYTTDQGGAFEVARTDTDHSNVLMQQITYANKPKEWGGTSDPTTNLLDDRMRNVTVSIEAHFTDLRVESKKENYVGIGARYNLADNDYSGYSLRYYETGMVKLYKDKKAIYEKQLETPDLTVWHTLSLSVLGDRICASVDGVEVVNFTDTDAISNSGRIAIYSDYQNNYFDNLKVTAEDDAYITRMDNTDAGITYSEGDTSNETAGWYHELMCSFKNYKRTLSHATAGDCFSFTYTGKGFAIIGTGKEAAVKLEIDGEVLEEKIILREGGNRQAVLVWENDTVSERTVKITLLEGELAVDSIEYVDASNE